ncbi:MAG: ATP-dependent helicase [Sedimentisphaeraceae bacterium JB056]
MSDFFSLDSLTPSQREAVEHKDGPMLVIAGPGSGKTRVITSRIVRLIEKGVRPYNICAITFTNKAAEEMRERVKGMGVPTGTQVSTFHSLCVRILRQYAEAADIDPNFSIYSDADQKKCIKDAIAGVDASSDNFQPAKVLSVISNLKNDIIEPDDFRKMANDFYSKMLAKIYNRYQNQMKTNNALDFDDLLVKTACLLRDHPDIRSQLSERFQYLLVDEYQDTNHAQYQIAKGLALDHGNICVTGDPDQSIYKWRGADIKNILAFEKDWPTAKIVKLEENFRSSPKILALADKLIAKNKERKDKRLVPTLKDSREIQCNVYEDERAEAHAIADEITSLMESGVDPNEIAILYRTNSMSRSIEEAFVKKGVPYIIVRGVEFYSRKEIRDMIAYLKLICNPLDNVAFARVVNTPARGIGATSVKRLEMYAAKKGICMLEAAREAQSVETLTSSAVTKVKDFAAMIDRFAKFASDGGSVAKLLAEVYDKSGMHTALLTSKESQEDAMSNIEELINSAAQYEQAAEEPSLFDYLQSISLYSDSDAYDPESGKVSLMTLHAAKGLEFENAFVIGLEQGILPHERSAEDDKELEEERRLFFVGITRAKMGLYISRVLNRTMRGQMFRSMPSKFLYETELISGFESTPAPEYDNGYSRFAAGGAGAGRVYGRKEKSGGNKRKSYGGATSTRRKQSSSSPDSSVKRIGRASALSAASSLPKASAGGFAKGDKVRHPNFGEGFIKEYLNLGANSVITVGFDDGQTKTLIQKNAGLEKIE